MPPKTNNQLDALAHSHRKRTVTCDWPGCDTQVETKSPAAKVYCDLHLAIARRQSWQRKRDNENQRRRREGLAIIRSDRHVYIVGPAPCLKCEKIGNEANCETCAKGRAWEMKGK